MEYVDAYIHTVLKNQYSVPTVMFVMRDTTEKRPTPSVVPVELEKMDSRSLEHAAREAIDQAPRYVLDLILYCSFETGYEKKKSFGVTFGCRDGYGNTLHQMYQFDMSKKKVKERPIIPNHNRWVPPTGIAEKYKDPVLTRVATEYSMMLAEKLA